MKNKNVVTEEIRTTQHYAHQEFADQLNVKTVIYCSLSFVYSSFVDYQDGSSTITTNTGHVLFIASVQV